MRLVEPVAKSFKVAKTFKENVDKINHINYSQTGDSLISSSDDDQIVIYDCVGGTPKRALNSKKYGVSLIQFTHSVNNAIHGSTKIDDTIRYLSLHDNKYIRYFLGHSKRVVSLCMSPVDDTFLSGALDKTIRLWDLRSQNCQGLMHVIGRPVAAFDPEGLIFAAGINSESIKLYDLRSFDKGPFTSFKLSPEAPGVEWTGLKFSPDGKMVLIGTNSNVVRLVDAFKGTQLHAFTGYHNPNQLTLESSFTPDSQFVLAGAADGRIHIWNSDTGAKVTVLHPYDQQASPVYCVRFNPKFMMLASASTNMSFWLPYIDE